MLDKFKVHLLAKWFTQIERVDYEETSSLVVKITSIGLILALISHLDSKLFQMD